MSTYQDDATQGVVLGQGCKGVLGCNRVTREKEGAPPMREKQIMDHTYQ